MKTAPDPAPTTTEVSHTMTTDVQPITTSTTSSASLTGIRKTFVSKGKAVDVCWRFRFKEMINKLGGA